MLFIPNFLLLKPRSGISSGNTILGGLGGTLITDSLPTGQQGAAGDGSIGEVRKCNESLGGERQNVQAKG